MSINSARNLVAVPVVGAYLYLTRHKLRFNKFIALGALCVILLTGIICFFIDGLEMGGVLGNFLGLPFLPQETEFTSTALVSGIEPSLNPVLEAVFYGETVGIMALVGIVIVVGDVVGYNVLAGRK